MCCIKTIFWLEQYAEAYIFHSYVDKFKAAWYIDITFNLVDPERKNHIGPVPE